ncbi:FAD-binding oxidoreductase [Thioalkalivibrio sp. ALE11]|uniref:FAD-binding oxidoreductase n=1 Tax=Thioalkalivibrio sp. ALE11 TaxID=1265494 RepID=UPI00036A4268|nr:FAD-binding oxidoreductase [Thioalkalivibrio sp. ALE11]
MTTSGWNRIPRVEHAAHSAPAFRPDRLPDGPLLAHGMGRSYGDCCLNAGGHLLHTRGLDRFVEFDTDTGVITAEAGVTLDELLELSVPRGWFPPVVPGTRFVTLGGAVANDVHGKNHHVAGSFGAHVKRLTLHRSDAGRVEVSPEHNPRWFAATLGGLGLTGLIETVTLQLVPVSSAWMSVWSERFHSLDDFWALDARARREWPYTVAWIDCLADGRRHPPGRGIYSAGRHAVTPPPRARFREPRRRVPVDPPFSLVNGPGLRAFNELYFRQPLRRSPHPAHHRGWLFPLDGIRDWNRIYGRRGFYQYQCVLPERTARDAVAELLRQIARSGQGSFLAVLKTFGRQPPAGMLSFPRPGTTLALDFPDRGAATHALFERLDRVVREAHGALYPAKDARMSGAMFRAGFPEWIEFAKLTDPQFSSSFWRRVTA